jgi:hypothetical protein
VAPIFVPPIDADIVRQTREALKMSRHVFAFKIAFPSIGADAGRRTPQF